MTQPALNEDGRPEGRPLVVESVLFCRNGYLHAAAVEVALAGPPDHSARNRAVGGIVNVCILPPTEHRVEPGRPGPFGGTR